MVKIGQYEVKSDLQYWDNYIWIERLNDNELFVGISDYAQHMLKDITSISPPSVGQRFISNSEIVTIESISREYILKSPVSCVILEVNNYVISNPEILNTKPFESWLLRVEVLDHGDLDQLIDGDQMADDLLDQIGDDEGSTDVKTLSEDFDYESEFTIDSGDYDEDYYNDGPSPVGDTGDEYSEDSDW